MAKSCITLYFYPNVSGKEGAVEWCPERRKGVDKSAKKTAGEKTSADSTSRSKASIFIAIQAEVPSQSPLRIAELRTGAANQQILGQILGE